MSHISEHLTPEAIMLQVLARIVLPTNLTDKSAPKTTAPLQLEFLAYLLAEMINHQVYLSEYCGIDIQKLIDTLLHQKTLYEKLASDLPFPAKQSLLTTPVLRLFNQSRFEI